MALMFLLGMVAVVGLVFAIKQTKNVSKAVTLTESYTSTYIAKAITAFIVVAHVSELHKAVAETSIINILATMGLFVIWMAVKSGTENGI